MLNYFFFLAAAFFFGAFLATGFFTSQMPQFIRKNKLPINYKDILLMIKK